MAFWITIDIEHAKRDYRRAPMEIMWHLACVEMCDESIVRKILTRQLLRSVLPLTGGCASSIVPGQGKDDLAEND